MANTRLPDYPGSLGPKQVIVFNHAGPASYTTGGETIGAANNSTGISILGLSGVDLILGSGSLSVSGTYYVRAKPVGTGLQKTQKLVWFVTSTNAEVAAAVDLSGETVNLGIIAR